METKHTKGEWIKSNSPWFDEEVNNYSGGFDIRTESGTKVVEVNAYKFWGLTFEEAEANAKLIAQSPNMLDVLNEVEDYLLSSQSEWMEGEEMLYNRIRSVILKATE